MTWHIVKTHANKEIKVQSVIEKLGVVTFFPQEPRYVGAGRHAKRTRLIHVPLLPRCVFVNVSQSQILDIVSMKHVRGIARNALGEAYRASDYEMLQFRLAHEQWAASLIKTPRKALSKKVKPIKLGDMSRFEEIMALCFGIEHDDVALVEAA